MKLEQYIRAEINNKIIPLVKKDKCEICNSDENLEVHHVKPFAEILEECLNDLNMDKRNTTKYTQKELYIITDYILGKHLRYKMMTVCHNCHKNIIHKEGTSKIGSGFDNWIEKNKLKKEYILKNPDYNLEIYLEKNQNKKLFKNKREVLINKINLKDNRNRLQKSISLINEYFEIIKLPYTIYSKRDNKTKLNNGKKNPNYKKTYWIVVKNIIK